MRWFGLAAAFTVIAGLVTACVHEVDGTVKPAPGLQRRPLSAQAITQVPLDDAALRQILGQTLVQHDPPESGGPDQLYDAHAKVSPPGCLGLTFPLQKSVYDSAEVTGFASRSWFTDGGPGKVIVVEEGVVAMSRLSDADALFTKFSKQWQECDGKNAVGLNGEVLTLTAIRDVRVTDSIVAATGTETTTAPGLPPLLPTRYSHAIGVESNCLVDVQVALFSGRHASDPGTGDAHTSGPELVRAMQHKISDLS